MPPKPAADARRFARIETLLDAALDLPERERAAYLRRACDGDVDLEREVADLLAAAEVSQGFLEGASVEPVDIGRHDWRLGPWRLLRRLGRGGMGEVWLAERDDGQFDQQVAVKLLRIADERGVPRLLREQRLLARLEHPGIARLLDAGSAPDGRPYMVVEYIDGLSLTAHCREGGLDLDARLALFDQVCDAVAYAHRHAIVHRDLKPANIMVRADGRVALLDFGIARVLDRSGVASVGTGSVQLTPTHAAPEQLAGGEETTLTDVYALGLVLYELLADVLPWGHLGGHAPLALLQRSLAGPPPAPSHRAAKPQARRLRGDLDAIVLKALRPEPEARYASVEALRDDLARRRSCRPVQARGDAFGYRLQRGLRRYWLATAAAGLVLSGLLVALGLVSNAREQALRERDLAQSEAARSKAVRDYVTHMFRVAGQHARDGVPLTAKQVLDQAATRVEAGFDADPVATAEVLRALGELHFYIDDYAAAEPLLRRWLAREADIADPTAAADVRLTLAQALFRMGHYDQARTLLDAAQGFWNASPEAHVDVLLTSRTLQSQLERANGEIDRAIATLEASLPQRLKHSGDRHFETAVLYNNLGAAYVQAGRLDAGVEALNHARRLWGALGLEASNDALNTLNNLAAAHFRSDDLASAETAFAQALALRRSAHGPSAATAALIGNYARVLQGRGKVVEALPLAEEAEAMAAQHAGQDSLLWLATRLTRAELLSASQVPAHAREIAAGLSAKLAKLGPAADSLKPRIERLNQALGTTPDTLPAEPAQVAP